MKVKSTVEFIFKSLNYFTGEMISFLLAVVRMHPPSLSDLIAEV